mmetsp:Transcript_8933/g.20905  ORF Transcript_8933/g.20905 Transcript_8933/m.20905 type:complete len:250 (-) Transcript_8933:245-994(-)
MASDASAASISARSQISATLSSTPSAAAAAAAAPRSGGSLEPATYAAVKAMTGRPSLTQHARRAVLSTPPLNSTPTLPPSPASTVPPFFSSLFALFASAPFLPVSLPPSPVLCALFPPKLPPTPLSVPASKRLPKLPPKRPSTTTPSISLAPKLPPTPFAASAFQPFPAAAQFWSGAAEVLAGVLTAEALAGVLAGVLAAEALAGRAPSAPPTSLPPFPAATQHAPTARRRRSVRPAAAAASAAPSSSL